MYIFPSVKNREIYCCESFSQSKKPTSSVYASWVARLDKGPILSSHSYLVYNFDTWFARWYQVSESAEQVKLQEAGTKNCKL